jgi:hypothetical protein
MDLDELKNTWTILDERLKKNEMLNKQIIQEMLYKKSNKSLNWLIGFDLFSIIIILLVIPLLVWLYNSPPFNRLLFPKITFAFSIAICILGVIWYFYKLKYLMNIDFPKIIRDNIHYMNKYSIMIKQEKIINYICLIPVIYVLVILSYYELKATFSLWVFLFTGLIVATMISYWSYKKIYDSNIQSIKKSLEELKELKEE